MMKINNKSKRINIGLQLLRMILCYWVIFVHVVPKIINKRFRNNLSLKHYHVPSFMLISFYFYYRHLKNRDINKIILRFKRLLTPYLLWPLIYMIINNLGFIINNNFGIYKKFLSPKDYFSQLIGADYYASTFWYLQVVLFISLLFTICAFLFRNKFLLIIQLFGIVIYRIHRSQIYIILKKIYFFRLFFVCFIRMMPIAIVGMTFCSINFEINSKKNYLKYLFINLVSLYFLFSFQLFNINDEGIKMYADVDSNILAAINMFYFFSLLPLSNIKNKKVLLFIKLITNHTGGIYYLHPLIILILGKITKFVKYRTIFGTILIYIYTYFFCFIGNLLFNKSFLKFLFN